jgi:hypothetical protein
MPTNLSVAWAPTGKADLRWQADITVVPVSLIACLASLAFMALSHTLHMLARADDAIE